jgi:traJ
MKENNKVRKVYIKVYVSPEDKFEIKNRARSLGLTDSTFLRNLGLGFRPTSMLDQDAILELAKINSAQSRLGNLMALALKNPEKMSLYGDKDVANKIDELIDKIGELQISMLSIVSDVNK